MDSLYDTSIKLDFTDRFTANPESIKRGIGLQSEAFREFKFENWQSLAS